MASADFAVRRLQAQPVPVAVEVLECGSAATSPRAALQLVVTAMMSEWCPPTQLHWMTSAHRVIDLVLAWLEGLPGESWEARWSASGADTRPRDWPSLAGITAPHEVWIAQLVANALVIVRAVVPTLEWLIGTPRLRLRDDWTIHHDTEAYRKLRYRTESGEIADRTETIAHLYRISVSSGRGLAELTGRDFCIARETLVRLKKRKGSLNAAWRHLKAIGLLEGEPDELAHVLAKPRLSPAGLVDRYGVRDVAVRELMIAYLVERETTCDYTTLTTTAHYIVNLFWVDLEAHEPGICSLALTPEQVRAWKARAQTLPGGGPRKDWPALAQTVRSFYLDLAAWSIEDAGRWSRWAAPCPIGHRELRALAPRRRRRQIAEMNARTRSLSPVLPVLVKSVTDELRRAEKRLEAAVSDHDGATFTVGNEQWRRSTGGDPERRRFNQMDVVAVDGSGRRVNLTKAEDRAFWTWSIVEVLRHTGIRIEELLELTHLSLRPFRKPDGQVMPLLQIAPSKSDAERILPVGPVLAQVLSRIVLRHSRGGSGDDRKAAAPTVPLVPRWDGHERVYSAPLPHLFQRTFLNGRSSVISPGTVRNWLVAAASEANLYDNDGAPIVFTPHDFRRIFLTDAVRNGLPIHIAAQLAGHDDLNTTRRYAATYPNEVIDHYQRFIARRRAERPVEEYRQPTSEELEEFSEHFGRRRVELGNCARPYGTGCTHEHACIRCSFLQVDPAEEGKLQDIRADLNNRIATARAQEWLGDVEQLQLTLGHLNDKQEQLRRLLAVSAPQPLITAAPTLSSSAEPNRR